MVPDLCGENTQAGDNRHYFPPTGATRLRHTKVLTLSITKEETMQYKTIILHMLE
jgi:hypothetical protein